MSWDCISFHAVQPALRVSAVRVSRSRAGSADTNMALLCLVKCVQFV